MSRPIAPSRSHTGTHVLTLSSPPAGRQYVRVSAETGVVTFRMPDPDRKLLGVRLFQDVRIPGDRLHFRYREGHWELTIDRPPVSRMEYLLELRHGDGGTENVLDGGNPRQVDGAFGPKSVLE